MCDLATLLLRNALRPVSLQPTQVREKHELSSVVPHPPADAPPSGSQQAADLLSLVQDRTGDRVGAFSTVAQH
jgi:hypothetical protein